MILTAKERASDGLGARMAEGMTESLAIPVSKTAQIVEFFRLPDSGNSLKTAS